MKKSNVIRLSLALTLLVLLVASVCTVLAFSTSADDKNIFNGTLTQTFKKTEAVDRLLECSNHYVVVKHKQLGGTHYAYTAALAESNTSADIHKEYVFNPGSQLVVLSVLDNGDGTVSTYEKILLKTTTGVIRDPAVSADGTKVLYSLKENTYDDFHIYEMDLTDSKYRSKQLTFGNGRSDIEPQYLANGNIVFSSNRDVQTVDCWITPVSNMYIMDGDGKNIRRVGYDQVHTTYPTVTADGRVLYTRWDYNDRTQMFIQSVFQMFQDGTYQTEVWGNGANFPTTLLHTRDIPGATGKYISIASGHHVRQIGKLCIVDSSKGRNAEDAISFLYPDAYTTVQHSVDAYGQGGRVYKYPYALDETTLLVSSVENYSGNNAAFGIYLCDTTKPWSSAVELVKGTTSLPASQIVPIRSSNVFNRPSSVNYAKNSGTYYVANVYEGASMAGVEAGTAKYLRVVEIVYRSSAIGATVSSGSGTADPFSPIATGNGAWDVKAVLGIVPIEDDGSVMFSVPSDTPVYFQLLDSNGCVIQTMRSWSTLMPGETFSCVGCHEDKNTAPAANSSITMAMKKGVQLLQKDLWMSDYAEYKSFDPYKDNAIGFSYVDMVQSIFDESCVKCHSNTNTTLTAIDATKAGADDSVKAMGYNIPFSSKWEYSISGGKSGSDYAPFGKPSSSQKDINTGWTSGTLTLKNSFFFSQYNKEACTTQLELKYSGNITVKINGQSVYSDRVAVLTERVVKLSASQIAALNVGINTIEITVSGGTNYFDGAFRSYVLTGNVTFVEKASNWKYVMSATNDMNSNWYTNTFDDSSWKTGRAPFGDRSDISPVNTPWTGAQNFIWIRQSFNITKEQLASLTDGSIALNIFYDDTISLYINGVLVMKKNNWNDSYEVITLTNKPQSIFKEGKNVIAVSLENTAGGREIDLALSCTTQTVTTKSEAPFSLTGAVVTPQNNRMMRSFPASYLFLTGSTPSSSANQVAGTNWVGRPSGTYVKWISTMSVAEILDPYYSGSFKSLLYTKLRSGHGNLTESQIRTIACWIDLAVPCFGTYDESENFSEDAMRMFVERENKRHFYDMWDAYVKMGLGGILPEGTLEVTYKTASGKVVTEKGNGYVILNLTSKLTAGDTLTVKVTGSKYIALSINERQGESLLYLPDGVYTFTVPSNLAENYNVTMRTGGTSYYRENTVFVRIPTTDELKKEHNLALNPYDVAEQLNAFPHVSAESVKGNTGYYKAQNAVDGFISNGSDKSWPYQAWVPEASDKDGITIDFGRDVKVNTLEILLRNAPNDVHALSATVTFSDGTKEEISMWNTDGFMVFDLGGRIVKSLTISDFELASNGTFSITEIRVFGSEK